MNKIILIGRLARDPELRYTNSNLAVANFDLAVSRPYNQSNKEEGTQPQTDFIRCQSWRNQAENLNKYCHKGSQVAIEGRIQTTSYEDQNGNKRHSVYVLCENITYLSHKKDDNQGQASNQEQNRSSSDPFADFGEEVVITDDDLPF